MRGFFGFDGPLMRALTELTNLLILNIITMVCSLPVVTAGAALTAMHYCIMKMADGEDSHLLQMYMKQFKGNLRSVTPAWLLFFGFGAFLVFDYQVFAFSEGELRSVALLLVYAAFIIYLGIYVWFFPLAARFENGFAAKFINSFLLAVGALPQTLAMMALWVVIVFVLTQFYQLFPLFVLFGISFPAYISSFLYYPVIKAQIKKALGDDEDGEGNRR